MIRPVLSFSVNQRWLVVLICAAAAAFGLRSLTLLPVDAVPDITNNQVQINALAPALSPADVEKQVTYPIETALSGIAGLQQTRSISRNGFGQVSVIFSDDTNIYFARQQVAERLGEARGALPAGVDIRMGPVTTGLGEITMWSVHFSKTPAIAVDGKPGFQSDSSYLTPEGQRLTTEVEKSAFLRSVQDWIVRPQVKTVPGVAGVDSIGGVEKQYQVQPDPAKLLALGLSFAELAEAVERSNASRGAGFLERNGEGLVVRSNSRLESTDDIANVVVSTHSGVPVHVRDVANVLVDRDQRRGSASQDGHEVVIGTALMLIGANSRTVSAAVDGKLQSIAKSLPPDIVVETMLNRTTLVDATIQTVSKNLAEGALLVIAVLFLMLGNVRAALIAASVIPVTMLLTVTGMVHGRISANLMSLGALDFGLIVDGAVIIAENCLRQLGERQHALGRGLQEDERLKVIVSASAEMIAPTVYGQAIIMLVYVPLLSFTGVEGKMFEPMAMTVIIALAGAFVLSLTFVPALIAIVITGRVSETDNLAIRVLKRCYSPVLATSIARPAVVMAGAAVVLAVAAGMATRLGQEFIPTLDEKNVAMQALRIPSTSLVQSQNMQIGIENAIAGLPEVATVFSKTGTAEVATDPMPPNASDTFIMLKPQSQWPDPSLLKEDLVQRIKSTVERLPGTTFEFSQPIQLRFNELLAGVRGDIAVKVFGDEFVPMLKTANEIASVLRGIEGASDVRVEQVEGLPFLEIKADRAELARLGLSLATVQDTIGAAIGGREAGLIFEGDRRYPIVLRLPNVIRDSVEALKQIPVSLPVTSNGPKTSVPLKQVASFTIGEGPNQISRENGKRRVVVTANVRGRDLSSVVSEAQFEVGEHVTVPAGYWLGWGGQFENLQAARQRLLIVVPACFFVIFLLLHTALRSVRDAILVFSAVPMALTGGITALWLRDMPLSISAAVGFIALSGVAVLNGLVMLSQFRQLREAGASVDEAIERGAQTRLRPVIMTALVAALGFVPMALATGTGAEVQKPLATVVIGGLISATLLTLIVLPSLYARFSRAEAVRKSEPFDAVPAE